MIIKLLWIVLLSLSLLLVGAERAWAFCGFYVSKADASLYNQASQVILAHHEDQTILTMASDYQGQPQDFALVVPVPTVITRDQVQVTEPALMERLDAFSAPRLVEYFDRDPCEPLPIMAPLTMRAAVINGPINRALGVTVVDRFTVGEYDIVILSAQESQGLATWLRRSGYQIPKGVAPLLQPYIRQGMKFFVARVNLGNYQRSGYQFLRPLQIRYQSPKFMLPIRLGMVNATGPQDLLVYILSPQGRAEVTNYRTVQVPSGEEIPLFVKQEFSSFYKAMFRTAYERENRNVAFLEYAWDTNNCDPCAAAPLTPEELRQAGAFWLDEPPSDQDSRFAAPGSTFITRLHVRYTRDKFPEDLMFQETANQEFFQGRYILRYPYTGDATCAAARRYRQQLPQEYEHQAETLAELTGWDIQGIRSRLGRP